MNIEVLFSTKERKKILVAVLFETGPLSVNETAARLKLSKGLVSKYLDFLIKTGVAKRKNAKFLIEHSAALVKAIKVLLNIEQIDLGFLKKYHFIEAVGLYGSCAKGENTQDSDVDLWVFVGSISEEKKAALAADIRRRINNVKPLFLTKEKIKALRKEDEIFYHALSFGSITLYGAPNVLEL